VIRLRHSDEWVGVLVIATVVLFVGAILEAGVLRDLFRPVSRLRIVLPDSGVGGLAAGADVEVLGTHAGTVRRIVLNPDQQMYAEADIDAQATSFIRRDSRAVIRRRFGLAGAAYVDISRGAGTPLDWDYAVVEAVTERAPTDTLSTMVDEVRATLLPALDDARQTMRAVASLAASLQQGQGTIGRLLTDDTLAREAETTVASVNGQVAALSPIIAELDQAVREAEQAMRSASAATQDAHGLVLDARRQLGDRGAEVAAVLRSAERVTKATEALLASLDSATAPHARFRGDLEAAARDLAAATASLRGLAQALERDPSVVLRGRSSR
jgi:phospholipid/cholesterol/gamma-HCH transport system substrate-binding protein